MAWLDDFARAMEGEDLSARLTEEIVDDLLDLARVVAHSSARRNAPLATFVAGYHAAIVVGRGGSIQEAVAEASGVAAEGPG